MKMTMEERLRNWGFHEEDIPEMLEELAKLPSIEKEEEILIAEAAFQALAKVKVPGYNYHQDFLLRAKSLVHGMEDEVELTYTLTIPMLKRRLARWK